MPPLRPSSVRYIKLGSRDAWARRCIERGEIRFGGPPYDPHAYALAGDWEGLRRHLMGRPGQTKRSATQTYNEIHAFYTLDETCLWVTRSDGLLWWTFAEPGVTDCRDEPQGQGAVMRKARGWRSTTLTGEPLAVERLSTSLTKVASYQGITCDVHEADALLRRINGEADPVVERARAAMAEMVEATEGLIKGLHQADFELLADLLVQRSGWQRVSTLGGTQPDSDLIIEDRLSGERALVQVKSQAGRKVLKRYLDIFEAGPYDHLVFVCHSPKGALTVEGRPQVHLWTGIDLARRVLRAGLLDWVIERAG